MQKKNNFNWNSDNLYLLLLINFNFNLKYEVKKDDSSNKKSPLGGYFLCSRPIMIVLSNILAIAVLGGAAFAIGSAISSSGKYKFHFNCI